MTQFLSNRAQVIAERHALDCNLCTDLQYIEIFRAVAIHTKQLREAAKGMDQSEASDFIAAHLHAASMRTLVGYQEKYNELVTLVAQVEAVMTFDQKAEFERLKAFAGRIH